MIIGYTTGVFDLFHVGHVRILQNARSMCDRLIVGVTTDELVCEYKKKSPVIPYDERVEIISSNRYVDAVVPQTSYDKMAAWQLYKFNIMFVGDDWKGTKKWNELEQAFEAVGVRIVYFPYTKTTSSTLLNDTLKRLSEDHGVAKC